MSDVTMTPVQHLLLRSDGTLTDMIETLGGERIRVHKLRQQGYQTPTRIDALHIDRGEWLVDRRVVLQGESTGRIYVYAQSLIALHRLEADMRRGLLSTDTPIGRLWKTCRVETFKEVIAHGLMSAGDAASSLDTTPDSGVLARTCRVQSRGLAVMLITEYFSPHWPLMAPVLGLRVA